MTRLVLIRHGQARAHVDQIVVSHDCTGLSPHGREQAEALRDRLARTGELAEATAFYASLMRRAAETAEIIGPEVGGGGLELRTDCGVCEQHHGEANGLGWEEFERRYGAFENLANRSRPYAPGGESMDEMVARVGASLERLATEHEGGTIVVACHGGVVGCSLEALAGVPLGSLVRYVENTSITEWTRDDSTGRWLLVRLNDHAHLNLLFPA